MRRLNWGCGGDPTPGWLNADILPGPGVDIVGDIRDGLPLADDGLDYLTSIHVLPEIPYADLQPTLRELRRVLRPGGRLVVGELAFDPHLVPFGSLRERAEAAGLALERRVGGPLGYFARFRAP